METEDIDDIKPINTFESKNKEYVKQYNSKYYNENKKRNLSYLAEKIECKICQCTIARSSKSEHEKTKKHQNKLMIKQTL
jgi:hypothetical protein